MQEKKIILLASNNFSSNIVFNQLHALFSIENIIVENKQNTWQLLKRRAKRLGWWTVLGQIGFILYTKWLGKCSQRRIKSITQQFNLDATSPPQNKVIHVNSINDSKTIILLQQLKPDIVIINGTRILSKELLSCVNAIFINMHSGITPAYRGVHGGYWALAMRDADHCGVTIHLVDEGIDTGNIVYQAVIQPTTADNFVTYPLLQLGAGIPLLIQTVQDALQACLNIQPAKSTLTSKVWSHPAIWQYLYYRIRWGVK